VVFTVSACSKSGGGKGADTTITTKPDGPVPVADPVKLVKSDIQKFASINSTAPFMWDRDHQGVFTKIFGGASAAAIEDYFNERITYFFTPDEFDRIPIQPAQP
jgi:hypothetical protein